MFLNNDNSIKWKRMGLAAIITTVIIFAGIFLFDKPLFEFMRGFNCGAFSFIEELFEAKVWLFVSALAALLIAGRNAIKNKEKRYKHSIKEFISEFKSKARANFGMMIFSSVFFASAIAYIAKIGIGRQRPVFFEALGESGFYPLTNDWAFNSMPSGHATATFAGLVMIGLMFPKIKWATWTVAIIVAVSRICYGAHWPSDIIFGAFIGMIAADLIKSFFFKNK